MWLIWFETVELRVHCICEMRLYVYLFSLLVIKFVLLSAFIRYKAIKLPPFNYLPVLIFMGRVVLQFGPSCLLKLGRFGPSCLGPSCLGPTFFMGRVVLGRLVFGPSCLEPGQTDFFYKGTGLDETRRWHPTKIFKERDIFLDIMSLWSFLFIVCCRFH